MYTSSLTSIPTSSPLSVQSTKDLYFTPRRSNVADAPLETYRKVTRLPYELREHCMIYFEEALCTPLIHLLIFEIF